MLTSFWSRNFAKPDRRFLLPDQEARRLGYAYANNHYAGHALATIKQFQELWQAKGLPEIGSPRRVKKEASVFD